MYCKGFEFSVGKRRKKIKKRLTRGRVMRIIVRVATRDANNERDNIKGDKPSCQRTSEDESRRGDTVS